MASSPSVTVEFSPKHSLPTKQPVAEEAKAHCLKWLPSDSASPSHFQKVTPVSDVKLTAVASVVMSLSYATSFFLNHSVNRLLQS